MADFLLHVGADVGLSYKQMQKDIRIIVSRLNSNPPKIKVAFDIDKAAADNIRLQITEINKALNNIGGKGKADGVKKITKEINNISSEAKKSAAAQVSAAKSAIKAENEHKTSLRQVLNIHREMLAAMRTNANAHTASSYAELARQTELFGSALDMAGTKAISINEAIKQVGLDGSTAIESAKTALSAFRLEMEQTGTSGTVNMNQMYSTIAQMQALLNLNENASKLETYGALSGQVSLFGQAIQLAATGTITLSDSLQQVGLNGSTAIIDAKTAMSAFKAELSGATLEGTKLDVDTESYNAALSKVNTLLASVRSNTEKWTAAKKGSSRGDYETYKQQASHLEGLALKLRQGTMSADDFSKSFSTIKAATVSSSTAIRNAGENTKSFADRIGGLSQKFGVWFSITRVIMTAYQGVRKMVSAVIELDTAMTELKKVTNETDSVYSNFLNNAVGRAKKLGATVTDTVNATADFARLGFNLDQASILSDAAMVYKNVGDGIQDINDASESIIAVLQAFSDEVKPEDVMLLVDKFNEVGNNYAISSKGVGDALLRSAAAMHAANNSLDETIALATAANTVVQDPEKVGTTLKTVSMFLRAARTEAEEAGESTEGMAKSVSELRGEILELTNNKVDIQIDEDTFKSTYQILKELSKIWDSFTDITQANILEMVGGKRNSNVVAALVENFSVAENALESSANSAGSALAENDKYLDSIQGRIAVFKASSEELSLNLINSDFVKSIVDAGADLVNFLNALQKLHVLLPTIVGTITIIKGMQIKKALEESAKWVSELSSSIIDQRAANKDLINSVSELTMKEKERLAANIQNAIASGQLTSQESKQILTTLGLANAEGTLIVANKGLGASFKTLMSSIPVWGWVALGLSVVIEGVIALTSALKSPEERITDLQSEFEELSNTVKTAANDFQNLKSSADETIPRFVELAGGVNELGENVSLTDEEYKEFLDLNNKIAEMFPELNLGMDENGNHMLALSYSSDTLKNSLYELLEAQRLLAAQKNADTMPSLVDNIKSQEHEFSREKQALQSRLDAYQKAYKTFDIMYSESYFKDRLSGQNNPLLVLEDKFLREAFDSFSNADSWQRLLDKYSYDEGLSLDRWGLINSDEFKNVLAGIEKEIDSFDNKISTKWNSLTPVVADWLRTDFLYNDMNKQMQEVAQAMVKGLDFSELGLTSSDSIQNYITDFIINPLYDSGDQVKTAFASVTTLEKELDAGNINFDEFSANVKAAFSGLLESMNPDEVDQFIAMFVEGFNTIGVAGSNFDSIVENIIKNWGSFSEDSGMNNAVTATLSDLSQSLQELKTNYELLDAAQAEMENDGLTASTIKALSDATSDYINYLYEENGVIKLNTEAWKEFANTQKDSDISSIERNIAALETERETIEAKIEALNKAAVVSDDFIGPLQEGTYCESAFSAALTIQNELLAKNTASLTENQNKLSIYSTLYNNIALSLDAYSAALANFTNIAGFIDGVSSALTTVADLQESIANGFVISLEKALEFASVYPEILNNATVAADGQINLNEGVINAFIEGKEAELKAQIDARVAAIEAEKAVAQAQLDFAQAQIDLLKSGDDAASAKITSAQIVAQAMIDAGVEEVKAYELAASAMSGDLDRFNKAAASVATDVDNNMSDAAKGAADDIYENMNAAITNIDDVARAAQNAAQAVSGIGTGRSLGRSSSVRTGTGGKSGKAVYTVDEHSFDAEGKFTYTTEMKDVNEYLAQLTDSVSNYKDAISQYNGQITALNALKTTSLSKFSSEYKKKSSGSSSDSDSESKEESWFEKQYKLHKHLLQMDAEEVSDYLDWLNSAYQQAYQEGIIDLDEFYKYQEEVYKGLQDLFKDYINDVEHEISMRENYDGESKKIISLYRQLISDVEREIKNARAKGLSDTDDYTQSLQDKWTSYKEAIKNIQDEITDNAKDAVDKLVDYQQDMIKQDIDSQKDALDKKMDYLKEFYDKQKELLQDKYDNEQYLDEQSEKRKSVSDIQAQLAQLEFDDSAWAQKRKAELQNDLSDAEDELSGFEKQHALELALDTLESSYSEQEAQLQKQLDALDSLLSNPELMFNKALVAIQGNTGGLYQAMLEFNRKYGTGNDNDVKDTYEDAYKALLKYKELYGKDYEGVVLKNSTGYKSTAGSWNTASVSGTNKSNQSTASSPKNTSKPSASVSNAPSLAKGSSVSVKKTATKFSSKSNNVNMASFVPGGSYTVYQTSGNEVLIGRDGVYTGWINKSDIVGYATGTSDATAGWHTIDELGTETVFDKDGQRYKLFTGGEKVLNAKASDFLYKFANGGSEILEKFVHNALGGGSLDKISPKVSNNEINMGDIVIRGNADKHTISEIRREQRSAVEMMLKEFNKLNK